MDDVDLPAFRGILRELADVFQRRLEDDTIQAYRKALGDLGIDQIRLGADRCARTGRYFPRPAEIRSSAEWRPEGQPSGIADAVECEACGGSGWVEYECVSPGGCGLRACTVLRRRHMIASRCTACREARRAARR